MNKDQNQAQTVDESTHSQEKILSPNHFEETKNEPFVGRSNFLPFHHSEHQFRFPK